MRNFVLAIIDGLRGDVPNLQRLKAEVSDEVKVDRELESLQSIWTDGTSFENWHTTHLKPEPALGSLLTGLYPREHGLYSSRASIDNSCKTLTDYFSTTGYRTILMNGHKSYYRNGIASKFDETLMGPPQRLFTRLKELNDEGQPVFVVYETLDLREPYLLSKFPPTEGFHDLALREVNNIAKTLGSDRRFEREDVHLMTSDWEIPQAATSKLPVWEMLIDIVHEHFEVKNSPLDNPVNHLVRYYLNTLELLSKNHFKSFQAFLNDEEVGQRTSMFLTSNSAHGHTDRNGVQTFGQRSKPCQDASRVPALFLNPKKELPDERELTSHVDLMPTILDDYEIDLKEDVSGQNLFGESSAHDRIFVEASREFHSSEGKEESEQEGEPFGARSILSWSSLMNSEGWKLYMRGLPITEEDLDLPLKKFLWTIMAKVTLTSPDEQELERRTESFQDNDSTDLRKDLLRNVKQNADPRFEFYNWKDDYHEKENLLQANPDPKLKGLIDELASELNQRFDDPYRQTISNQGEQKELEEVDLLAPMQAVGYVE